MISFRSRPNIEMKVFGGKRKEGPFHCRTWGERGGVKPLFVCGGQGAKRWKGVVRGGEREGKKFSSPAGRGEEKEKKKGEE